MTRYSRKDVDNAVSMLAEELGTTLKLVAWSPGDRLGTRYRVHMQGDTDGSLGTKLFSECGAKLTTERIWTGIEMVRIFKKLHKVPAYAVEALENIEAPPDV